MIDKTDCFARRTSIESLEGYAACSALDVDTCNNCKFYRNDITRAKIEKDIKEYSSCKGAYRK